MSQPESIIAKLAEQHAPASHIGRIKALWDLASSEQQFLALALVGSYAKGTGNRISDLDLVAIVRPENVLAAANSAAHLLEAPEVLNSFRGTHPSGGMFCKLVYLDFSSVEFHVFPQGCPFRLRNPYLVLWDPQNVLPSLIIPGAPVQHGDFTAYQYGDAGLIWELVDCIKWLNRGEHGLAKQHLVKLAEQVGSTRGG